MTNRFYFNVDDRSEALISRVIGSVDDDPNTVLVEAFRILNAALNAKRQGRVLVDTERLVPGHGITPNLTPTQHDDQMQFFEDQDK